MLYMTEWPTVFIASKTQLLPMPIVSIESTHASFECRSPSIWGHSRVIHTLCRKSCQRDSVRMCGIFMRWLIPMVDRRFSPDCVVACALQRALVYVTSNWISTTFAANGKINTCDVKWIWRVLLVLVATWWCWFSTRSLRISGICVRVENENNQHFSSFAIVIVISLFSETNWKTDANQANNSALRLFFF